jgi:hypothetical protein
MHVRSELGETSVSSQALSELGAGESVGRGDGGSVGMASQQAHSSPPPQPRAS